MRTKTQDTTLARLALLAAPIAVAAALVGSALAAQPSHTSALIMRDGGICDPIRHMGC